MNAMNVTGHLDPHILNGVVVGDLGGAALRQARRHAARCGACGRRLRTAERAFRGLTVAFPAPTAEATAAGRRRLRRLLSANREAAYGSFPGPFGEVFVAVSERGVCRVSWRTDEARFRDEVEALGLRAVRRRQVAATALRQVREYLAGRRERFDLPIDLVALTPFQRAVLEETATVPRGAFSTYGDIARRVGRPRAYRAVGNALNINPVPLLVPCHRVLAAGGALGGYGGGLDIKRFLLELEGVLVA